MELKNLTITLTILGVFFLPCVYAENDYSNKQPANIMIQEDFSEYMSSVQEKLRTLWQPPDFMEEGHVRVYFKLNRQGKVVASDIIESSGNDIYDESALDAIKKADPFGEFPEQTLREHIAIKYSFDTVLIEEERMKGYYELAKKYTKSDPLKAIEYLNLAINEVGGEEASCFLYKRRADLKTLLGNTDEAQADYDKYNLFLERARIKRMHLLKHLTETQDSAYLYHYLAFAYEELDDYDNAMLAINKAVEKSDYSNEGNIKRYKKHLEKVCNSVSNQAEKTPPPKLRKRAIIEPSNQE